MLRGSGELHAACGFVGVTGGVWWFGTSTFLGTSGQIALAELR